MTLFDQLMMTVNEIHAVVRAYRDRLREVGRDDAASTAKDARLDELKVIIDQLHATGVVQQMTPTQRLQFMSLDGQYDAVCQEVSELEQAAGESL